MIVTEESVGTEIKKSLSIKNKSKRNYNIKKPKAMLCCDERFKQLLQLIQNELYQLASF